MKRPIASAWALVPDLSAAIARTCGRRERAPVSAPLTRPVGLRTMLYSVLPSATAPGNAMPTWAARASIYAAPGGAGGSDAGRTKTYSPRALDVACHDL